MPRKRLHSNDPLFKFRNMLEAQGLPAMSGRGRLGGHARGASKGVTPSAIVSPAAPVDTQFFTSGTDAIVDTATTREVSHGLGSVPETILVTPQGGELIWVPSRDHSIFTVERVGSTGILDFDWLATGEPAPDTGGGGPVTLVDATFDKDSNLTTSGPLVPVPTGASVGDLLVAHYCGRGLTNFTPPAGWTSVVEVDNTADNTIHLFWKFLESGDPSSFNGTVSTAVRYGVGVIAVSGANTTNPIDTYDVDSRNSGSASPNYPALTVAADGSMIIGAVSATTTATTEPTGTTERWDLGSGASSRAAGDGWSIPVDAGVHGPYVGAMAEVSSWASIVVAIAPG